MATEQYVKKDVNQYMRSSSFFSVINGGLNTKLSPAEISEKELSSCQNIMFSKITGGISSRYPARFYVNTSIQDSTGNEIPKPITGLYQSSWVDSNGNIIRSIIATGGSKIFRGRINPSESFDWYDITGSLVRTYDTFTKANMVSYGNYCLIADGSNKLTKIDSSFVASEVPGAPEKCKFVEIFADRGFLAGDPINPQRLYFSELGDPTTWNSTTNSYEVGGKLDGDPIMGLAQAFGCLLIFKRNSVYALTGTSTSDFALTRLTNDGLVSAQGCTKAQNEVYYISDNGLFKINESKTCSNVSYYGINEYKNLIQYSGHNKIVLGYDKINSLIFVSGTTTANSLSNPAYDTVYAHDLNNLNSINQPAMAIWKFYNASGTNLTPIIFSEAIDELGKRIPIFCCATNDYVYSLTENTYHYDQIGISSYTPIVDKYSFKFLNLGDTFSKKKVRFIRLVFSSLPQFVQNAFSYVKVNLTYNNNYDTTSNSASATVPTNIGSNIRLVAPQPPVNTGNLISVGLEISGVTTTLIGYEIDFIDYGRRG